MANPWEKYGNQPATGKKPWEKYAVQGDPALYSSYADAEPETDDQGDFTTGLKHGLKSVVGTGYGLVGMAGAAVDSDSVRDWGYDHYRTTMDEMQPEQKAQYSFDGVNSLGDAADFAQYWLGYGVSNMAVGLATGGAGSTVAKTLSKEAIESGVEKYVAKKVAEGVVTNGATREAAAAAARQAITQSVSRKGFVAGVAPQAFGQEIGATYGEAADEAIKQGGTLDDVDVGKAAAYGTAAGALEFGADVATLGLARIGPAKGAFDMLSHGSTPARVIKRGLVGSQTEGLTEVGQTALEARGAGKPEAETNDLLTSYFAGAIPGAAAGGVGGIHRPDDRPAPSLDERVSGEVDRIVQQQQASQQREGQAIMQAERDALDAADAEEAARVEAERIRERRVAAAKKHPFEQFEPLFKDEMAERKENEKALTAEAKQLYGEHVAAADPTQPLPDLKTFTKQHLADNGVTGEKLDIRQEYVNFLDEMADRTEQEAAGTGSTDYTQPDGSGQMSFLDEVSREGDSVLSFDPNLRGPIVDDEVANFEREQGGVNGYRGQLIDEPGSFENVVPRRDFGLTSRVNGTGSAQAAPAAQTAPKSAPRTVAPVTVAAPGPIAAARTAALANGVSPAAWARFVSKSELGGADNETIAEALRNRAINGAAGKTDAWEAAHLAVTGKTIEEFLTEGEANASIQAEGQTDEKGRDGQGGNAETRALGVQEGTQGRGGQNALPAVQETQVGALAPAGLSAGQQVVHDTLAAAAVNNEFDQFQQSDGKLNYTAIANAAGLKGKQAAYAAVKQMVDKIATQLGTTRDGMKDFLRNRTAAVRTTEASDEDMLGTSPENFTKTSMQPGAQLDSGDLFGNAEGATAGFGTIETVGGSQGATEGGENSAPTATDLARPDPVAERRVAEAMARYAAIQSEALAQPEAEAAAADWDDMRSDRAPFASDLSRQDAYDWLMTYMEWKNGDITEGQLAAEQMDIERRYDASADKAAVRGDRSGAVGQAEQRTLGEGKTQAGETAENAEPEGDAQNAQDEDAKDLIEVVGQLQAIAKDNPSSAFEAKRHIQQVLNGGKREVARANAFIRLDKRVTEDRADRAVVTPEPVAEDLNPIEARVAELRKHVGEIQGKRLDKLVERYAEGDIDLERLTSELDMLEEQSFPADKGGKGVMFSKGTEQVNLGQSPADITAWLKGFFASPAFFDRNVTVVATTADLPDTTMQGLQLSDDDVIKGVFDPTAKRVFIVAENITDKRDALATFLHEVGVHMGMKNLLGPANYDRLVGQIRQWAESGTGVEADLANRALERITEAEQAGGTTYDKATADDELIAYFVEEAVNDGINPTALTKESASLREWFRTLWAAAKVALRKLGINPARLTAKDVVDLAYGAARMETNGSWHGTAADFKRFDHKFMGSGEGAQAFGWGSYLAQRSGIAYGYWGADVRRKKSGTGKVQLKYATGSDVPSVVQHNLSELGVYDMFTKYLQPDWHAVVSAKVAEAEAVVKAHEATDAKAKIAGMFKYVGAKRELNELRQVVAHGLMVSGGKRPEGNMLRTDVAVQANEWLEWDKPMSEQSQLVKDALEKVRAHLDANETLDEYLERYNAEWDELSGQEAYLLLQRALEEDALIVELDAVDDALAQGQRDKAASLYLDSLGVKGLKFLDGQSRLKGEGTSNLVVFNDKNIQRVYSAPGAKADARKFSIARRDTKQMIDELPDHLREPAHWMNTKFRELGNAGLRISMFTQDLVDSVESVLPSARSWFESINKRETIRIGHEAEVDDIASRHIDALTPSQFNRTWKLLHDMTRSQKWAYVPTWKSTATVDPEMGARYDALDAAEKAALDAVLKHGNDTLTEVNGVLDKIANDLFDEKVNRATTDATKKKLADDKARYLRMYGRKLMLPQGPYAPMRRVGTHIAVGKSQLFLDTEALAKTGNAKAIDTLSDLRTQDQHFMVSFHEGKYDAERQAREYDAAGMTATASAKEVFTSGDQLPFQAFQSLREMATQQEGQNAIRLMNMIDELYLTSLADVSARKSELKREGVGGLNPDTMYKAFLSKGKANAHYLSVLKTHRDVAGKFSAMRSEANASSGTRGDKMDAFNELKKRYESSFDYQPSPLVSKLMGVSTYWMLLTKPAYYLYNLTQPFMMTLPYITKRHDYMGAANHLVRAYSDLLKTGKVMTLDHFNLDALPMDIRSAMKELRDMGRLDITITQDLGNRIHAGQGNVSKYASRMDNFFRTLAQKTEMANRVVTAASAYRLHLEKTPGDTAGALTYAADVVDKTQGNYSNFNAPRLFNMNSTAKLMTQFKKFQLIQATLLITTVKGIANPHERAASMRALKFMLGHHALLAGAMGLPAINLIAMAFAAAGDDDEPRDLELWMKKNLGDDALGQVLRYGVPALFNVNMSANIGMGQTFSVIPYADVDATRSGYDSLVTSLMGPTVGGLGPQLWGAAGKGVDGDYYGMLAGLLPGFLKSSMKAMGEAVDGTRTGAGDQLVTAEDITFADTLLKSVGLRTMKDTTRQLITGKRYEFEGFFRDSVKDIKTRYNKAYREGDGAKLSELRDRWLKLQQFKREYGFKSQPLSQLIKAPRDQAKRERMTAGGVQYNTGNEGFVTDLVEADE